MHLVLQQSVLDKAIALVQSAQDRGKVVERLEVDHAEMEGLLNCPIGPNRDDPQGEYSCMKDGEIYILGVPVVMKGRYDTKPALAKAAERA